MTVLFSHDWTGTDGAAWDSGVWTVTTEGTPTVTIDTANGDASGRGEIDFNGSSDRVIAYLATPIDTEPTGMLVRIRTDNDEQSAHLLFVRGSGTWASDDVTDGYRILINHGSEQVIMRRYISDASTDFNTGSLTITANTDWWFRWEVFEDGGSTRLRWRAWADGGAEPGTWTVDTTDSTVGRPSSGSIAVGGARINGNNSIFFDDLEVTDLQTSQTLTAAPALVNVSAANPALAPDSVALSASPALVNVEAVSPLLGAESAVLSASPALVSVVAVSPVAGVSGSALLSASPALIEVTAPGASFGPVFVGSRVEPGGGIVSTVAGSARVTGRVEHG